MSTITSLNQLDFSKRYTYADYLKWQLDERVRVELHKGVIMSLRTPYTLHQQVSGALSFTLWKQLKATGAKVYAAPFDVRLPSQKGKVADDEIDTVVQPDLSVFFDKSKLDKRGGIGAPDLIIEILSPSNSKREMRDKYELYEEAGVLEYWIVDPIRRSVLVYILQNEKFISTMRPLVDEDILTAYVFPDLKVDLAEVFPEEEEDA